MTLSADERDELRSTARALLGRASSPEQVRSAISKEPGFDRALWDQMVGLGWTTIHIDEHHGGAGYGFADVAIILYELGRSITPSPFLASAVLASTALARAANDAVAGELLRRITSGDALGTVALASADGSYDPARASVAWRSDGSSVRLTGSSSFVLDADLASVLVVSALDVGGTLAVLAVDPTGPGIRVERTATVDMTRRLFTVAFDDVSVPADRMLCEPGTATGQLVDQVLAVGVVAACCDAAGVADRALERVARYATERTQFGKPIGSFQAVKHHCANMAIAVEASRAATGAAAGELDGDPSGWARTAAITSSYVGPACSEACALGLLVHGGIGFTWEQDSHLYLKRAKLDELLFGRPSWHRRRLADAVFPALVHPMSSTTLEGD
jgi:alkylation response protein AidB-like acyl-CoA dehydrogenase